MATCPSVLYLLCVCLVTQSWLTLCIPIVCSPPGSSVHGILQARILEWVAIPFSTGSSRPRYWTQVSYIAGGSFTLSPTKQAPLYHLSTPKLANHSINCLPASRLYHLAVSNVSVHIHISSTITHHKTRNKKETILLPLNPTVTTDPVSSPLASLSLTPHTMYHLDYISLITLAPSLPTFPRWDCPSSAVIISQPWKLQPPKLSSPLPLPGLFLPAPTHHTTQVAFLNPSLIR